jgi:hypothetical protein
MSGSLASWLLGIKHIIFSDMVKETFRSSISVLFQALLKLTNKTLK